MRNSGCYRRPGPGPGNRATQPLPGTTDQCDYADAERLCRETSVTECHDQISSIGPYTGQCLPCDTVPLDDNDDSISEPRMIIDPSEDMQKECAAVRHELGRPDPCGLDNNDTGSESLRKTFGIVGSSAGCWRTPNSLEQFNPLPDWAQPTNLTMTPHYLSNIVSDPAHTAPNEDNNAGPQFVLEGDTDRDGNDYKTLYQEIVLQYSKNYLTQFTYTDALPRYTVWYRMPHDQRVDDNAHMATHLPRDCHCPKDMVFQADVGTSVAENKFLWRCAPRTKPGPDDGVDGTPGMRKQKQ